jgi:phosphoglycolate phosphatase/pyrophosphatase PpaX
MSAIPESPLKAVIFDFDGTVAHTLPICIEAFRLAALPLTGRRYSDFEITATFGPSEEGSARALTPHAPEECLAAYLRHYEELHADCLSPFDGIPELLTLLGAKGIKVGLVTGKGAGSCQISLRMLGMADVFDAVETGCAHGPCKPEGIRAMLGSWGIEPTRAAYVGDSPSDVVSARSAGVLAVGAAWAESADAGAILAQGPDALFTSLDEFRAWVSART